MHGKFLSFFTKYLMIPKIIVFKKTPPGILLAAVFMMVCFAGITQQSTDTLRLTLQQAEQQFIEKNLTLLAAHYNVDASKALSDQAKLWDNPILITDQNLYADGKFMGHGKTVNGQANGQIFIQVQQLIKTAGKRGKLISLATTNTQITELQLLEVIRNLKYQLRTDYFTIARYVKTNDLLEKQSSQLQLLLKGMEAQLKAGNIANKDYLRVQAILVSLQQDIHDNTTAMLDAQAELKTLLLAPSAAFIKPTDEFKNNQLPVPPLDNMVATAKQNNAAYLIQKKQETYGLQNLDYQKALRTPDITVAPEYDKASNYTNNYFGLTLSLPLPLFNKNQGNIKSAQFTLRQQETLTRQSELALENDVVNAYSKLLSAIQQNGTTQQDFYRNYKIQFDNIVQSFQQRQISMLEFIDFFNDFKDVNMRLLQQQLNLEIARQEVNYVAGADIL